MARKWSNRNVAGALHFVTGNVLNRLPVFRREAACCAFLEECQRLRVEMECKLIAFVVMPDHFHLIVNPRDGRIREWTGALKSLSAKRLIEIAPGSFIKDQVEPDGSRHQVWQESFKALPLWSDWMIWQKINYIHANPLRARLVKSAKYYRWSTLALR
jgi:REP-associated tyrosine transposase